MIKNIYSISNEGSITHYAHFFFAMLLPLIYYDIITNSQYNYNIKINIGSMINILETVFPNRITTEYENVLQSISDKQTHYNLYILFKKQPKENDVLLDAFDIFNISNYSNVIQLQNNNYTSWIHKKEFLKLENDYINYYYETNIKLLQYEKKLLMKTAKYKKLENSIKKNKLKYKQLYITDKFLKLKKYTPLIKHFFDSKIDFQIKKKIILIERKFSKIDKNNFNNYSGQRRIIYNHLELKNKLSAKYGDSFINICLDEMNIFEQYNLFKNAQIIIGQHGAGLSNIFFSNKATLIEICPDWNIDNYWFQNLANFCNMNYIPIEQNRMTKKEWDTTSNIKVDIS
jgi:hypothetical protein